MNDLSAYVPLLFMAALAIGFAVFSAGIAPITGPKRYNSAKVEPYECGIQPTPHAVSVGGGRFPIKYYLTAMLFIVFDIEIVFLYPWALKLDNLGMFGLVAMIVFLVPVLVVYAYEWQRGGLEWE